MKKIFIRLDSEKCWKWHSFGVQYGVATSEAARILRSRHLYHYIRQCEKDNVDPIVDMNGGYTPAPAIPSKHSDVVFVGGGIGVTLLMGQLVHILHTHPNQTVWLIWHVRGSNMLLHNTLINCFRNVVVPNVLQSVQDCFTACAGSVYHSHTMTAPYMLAKNAI
ncbi:hypothetical protein AC1031_020079 [Aphanomyces cochlioides]|nr:hypothetical protein AC1031_020079 [Aphanomyces cochlioides]